MFCVVVEIGDQIKLLFASAFTALVAAVLLPALDISVPELTGYAASPERNAVIVSLLVVTDDRFARVARSAKYRVVSFGTM